MKILYVNNDGGGFADTVEVDEGTTVASLFADKVSGLADYFKSGTTGLSSWQ